VAGALIDSDNRGRGALIGAAAGGALGAGAGYVWGRQRDKYEAIEGVEVEESKVVLAGGPPPTATPDGAAPAPTGPTTPVEKEALTLRISSEVLFERGSSSLSQAGAAKVREVAEVLKEYPNSAVYVVGYTSSEGGDALNMDLSKRRAEVVANQLIVAGVAPSRVTPVGLGSSDPIADNSTEAGRVRNRRVEIKVVPYDQK
jgi:outer membrane protein OmpA-like peptidoglycan-associated protein